MRMTAIHNELMRTRTLPIQCRTNEVDSHSGNNINRADYDDHCVSNNGQTSHKLQQNLDCCFQIINIINILLTKYQEVDSSGGKYFQTIPFQHIRLFLWWDDEPLSSSVMYVF